MNRTEIKNPHRIYPGDTIVLDMSSGSPQLRLLRETVMLEPGVREEALEKAAVPTISPYIIAPFLSQPLVIENDALNYAPSIVGGQEDRVVLSPGVKIYVDRISEGEGAFWQVYRNGKVLADAITNEFLGTEAFYLGDARVTNYGEPASAEVVRAKEEIFIGDKLVAAPEESTASFVPRAPDGQISGSIISIYNGVGETGADSIVTIDRGRSDGLEEGHVLAIYRGGKLIPNPKANSAGPSNKLKELNIETKRGEDGMLEVNIVKDDNPRDIRLPDERVGLLMIFRTFNRVSYGLVMQASEPVHVLDLVLTP